MILDRLRELWTNDILWIGVLSSTLAQFLKPFTYYLRTRSFDWRHIAAAGGMPSSHSALVSAVATGIALDFGFDSPMFALAVAMTMIVTYDAAGIRRQAGEHARAINLLIAEALSGHPMARSRFKEVLGHNRQEVAAGVVFGIVMMLAWKLLIQPLFI